jgi:hypothetical protein
MEESTCRYSGEITMGHKTLEVLALGAMHDTAIRSYYGYQLLNELASSQKKSFLDTFSLILGVFASIAGIVGAFQYPPAGLVIVIGTVLSLALLAVVWLVVRHKIKDADILSYGTYLAIIIDELLKYTSQIKLLKSADDREEEFAKAFLAEKIDTLRASKKDFLAVSEELKLDHKYDEVLEEFGWKTERVTQLLADIDGLLEGSK